MLLQDLRYALRQFEQAPGITVVAILTLALGFGANSAMFSVIDGILLKPLPYDHPENLVNVWVDSNSRHIPHVPSSAAKYDDWRRMNTSFSGMAAWLPAAFNLQGPDGIPERLTGAAVSAGFLNVLGVQPIAGRGFSQGEDQPGKSAVALIGSQLWKLRFGGDPGLIGRQVSLNGKSVTVIGVLPESFALPSGADIWTPLVIDGEIKEDRDLHVIRVIGRLRSGVTLERAQAEFDTIAAQLAKQYPDFDKGEAIRLIPALEDAVGGVRPALLVLLGAVAFVLLIACANVANLLLVQASGRRREMAIRSALGADRRRMIVQLLNESVLLSLLGAALGLLFSFFSFRTLIALAPAAIPRLSQAQLNPRAVLFTLALAFLTGILFGLAPAWQATQTDLNTLLKDQARGNTSRGGVRNVLVVSQVAAALILLTGAGLLMRSFYQLGRVDPGFDPTRVLTLRVNPSPARYGSNPGLQVALAKSLLAGVSSLGGVRAAGISTDIPLTSNAAFIMRLEGFPLVTPAQAALANY
jgi:putative ABC transport system permease protein